MAHKVDLEKADVIVVFQGADSRVGAAYQLIDSNQAPVLIISPATAPQLNAYDRLYCPIKKFNLIIEQNARTTFENALYTAQLINQHRFKSLILVTSWNHMPRSYLLINMLCIGTDTDIRICNVATGHLNQKNWYRYLIGWKMIYNEMLKTWGSLVEWITYLSRGELLDIQPGKSSIFSSFKKYLLFNIDQQKLNMAGT